MRQHQLGHAAWWAAVSRRLPRHDARELLEPSVVTNTTKATTQLAISIVDAAEIEDFEPTFSHSQGTLSHSAVTFMFLKCYIIIDRQLVQHLALGRGGGWAVLDTQRSLWARTKTARVAGGAHVALTRPPLSRFALHFARLSCYLDLRSVREQRVRRSHFI